MKVRFEMCAQALDSSIITIAPWRDAEFLEKFKVDTRAGPKFSRNSGTQRVLVYENCCDTNRWIVTFRLCI